MAAYNDALALLEQGRRVRRTIWGARWIVPNETGLVVQQNTGDPQVDGTPPSPPSYTDQIANDWQEVTE